MIVLKTTNNGYSLLQGHWNTTACWSGNPWYKVVREYIIIHRGGVFFEVFVKCYNEPSI